MDVAKNVANHMKAPGPKEDPRPQKAMKLKPTPRMAMISMRLSQRRQTARIATGKIAPYAAMKAASESSVRMGVVKSVGSAIKVENPLFPLTGQGLRPHIVS